MDDSFKQTEFEFNDDAPTMTASSQEDDVPTSEDTLDPEIVFDDEEKTALDVGEEKPSTPEEPPAETTEPSSEEDTEDESGDDVVVPDDSNGTAFREVFADYYVQYSSYVVRDRAVPDVDDGLKPVQRRILYCMHKTDDGRYHKVAGVVGDTMHYHPHGDASIAGALVTLANKEYYIDKQGSWGDVITGMEAAAPRYIECRLTQLARETMFNDDITEFVDTYDARAKEPVRLPAKIPSLLMLGSDGIAAGMATHIFSHNFGELLDAEMAVLRGEPFQLFPDFIQGGLMDASEYADGEGRVKVRAKIEADGDKRLIIKEIPAGTTTESLLASIEAAWKKGKVKLASVNDYTAGEVNIELALPRGIYAEDTIKALYAYTDCEKNLTSDLLVICDKTPMKMTVTQVLKRNAEKLKDYLRMELELAISRFNELILYKTLAQIFVENRIYKRIESAKTIEAIFKEVYKGFEKVQDQLVFHREINDDDIEKLLQIPIRRISAFDIAKNEQEIADLKDKLADAKNKLAHLVDYAIDFLKGIKEKYAGDFPRRTKITGMDVINKVEIARRNIKVYFDRQGHFVGTNVKSSSKDASPLSCTEYDKLVLLRGDGTCKVIDIPEKEYVGQTKFLFRYDKEQIFCILYRDKVQGTWYVKRFKIGQYILGKEYHVVPPNCLIEQLYTSSGVVVSLELASRNRRTLKSIEVDFDSYELRSREARGFKLTSFEVVAVKLLERNIKGAAAEEGASGGEPAEEQQPAGEEPPASTEPPKENPEG